MKETTVLKLTEYQTCLFERSDISEADAILMWQRYSKHIYVEEPGFKTDGKWRLTAQGWVGYLPISENLSLYLQPKVSIRSIFRMLEYAYDLDGFLQFDGLLSCATLSEVYDLLASVLAQRILERGRKGYYRTYIPQADQLPFVRGRIDARKLASKPWDVDISCQYEEHTSDIEDNQVLAWTMSTVARSGLCNRSAGLVRRAYHSLLSLVTITRIDPSDCVQRMYNRLNMDYEPMHALCRFFLESSGPCLGPGNHKMIPFLINVASLFELFVYKWLDKHLPPDLKLIAKEKVRWDTANGLLFEIDMVIYDTTLNSVRCVLDTKYKAPVTPDSADVAQVVAYAQSKHCSEAVLIFPSLSTVPIDSMVGNTRIRSLSFVLADDLEEAGERFVSQLLAP